ncbi:electron transfer flavoprotein subunit beta/FixA family protein [Chitinispirillales bacterium ANBcel5]|uniref:electron transfer flavoprotein subunit beta/FixA family protein n=1 Tax=Cellulosispirillum alkaliphilum TaxID=3039283 RepID=UPI002A59821A|nr:electron transfer flavoprotein subunit beta/FixA family protein [Chitinispirillales bacterium ANBcel5]
MNIVVLIKQVPGTTQVKINPDTGTLIRDGVEAVVNPFDEYAIEEAVRIKEKVGGVVKVVTMGPPQAESALRTAISMGADEGILISDRAFAGSDTWATSYTLAKGIQTIGDVDLIISGKQAIDGDTAQVGPGVAEMLGIPFVAWVRKIEEITSSSIRLERLMEGGYDVVEMPLPGLITVVKEINTPRMASLKGKMKAKKATIKTLDAASMDLDENRIGLKGSPTQVLRSFVPERKSGGEKIEGEVPDLVDKLQSTILDLGIVK